MIPALREIRESLNMYACFAFFKFNHGNYWDNWVVSKIHDVRPHLVP